MLLQNLMILLMNEYWLHKCQKKPHLMFLSFQVKDKLPNNLLKALTDGSHLFDDHCKIYWEKLRAINPPCVPFYGQYQTKIVFVHEGNPDFLANTNLINFTKRRKVADIISEIQQYQNQPYCLKACPEIRCCLENLDPFPNMDEVAVNNYLWQRSIEVEPKDSSKRKLVRSYWTLRNVD